MLADDRRRPNDQGRAGDQEGQRPTAAEQDAGNVRGKAVRRGDQGAVLVRIPCMIVAFRKGKRKY